MGTTEDLCDALARDVIAAMDKTGDETLVDKVARILASTSSTTQEAFMTCVRVRLSERRAGKFLDDLLAGKNPTAPAAQSDPGGH